MFSSNVRKLWRFDDKIYSQTSRTEIAAGVHPRFGAPTLTRRKSRRKSRHKLHQNSPIQIVLYYVVKKKVGGGGIKGKEKSATVVVVHTN